MSEQTTTTTVPDVQANTPPVAATPQAPVVNVQPANVDTNAIVSQAEQKAVEAAEKKMEAVFKSMLQQQGLDADSINKMTVEWKAKQVTPDMQIQELQQQLEQERIARTTLEKHTAVQSQGITDPEDVEYICFKVDKRVTKTKDFKTALAEYLEEHPYKKSGEEEPEKPPVGALYLGTKGNKTNQKEKPPVNYTQALFGRR